MKFEIRSKSFPAMLPGFLFGGTQGGLPLGDRGEGEAEPASGGAASRGAGQFRKSANNLLRIFQKCIILVYFSKISKTLL